MAAMWAWGVRAAQKGRSIGGLFPRRGLAGALAPPEPGELLPRFRGEVLGHLGLSRRPRVAVGMSGGVDSSVAALLLRDAGCEVFGVFMRNWDDTEEGSGQCSTEADLRDAQAAAEHLGIDLVEVNFVAEYWQEVFQRFLAECQAGLTPNPDLACNRHIKFKMLLDRVTELGADALATGHYARLRDQTGVGRVELLCGADAEKDQSYFLAQVPGAALRRCIFPLGGLTKREVRLRAETAGLHNAARRSSAGICFIGRRNFASFLSEYIEPTPGAFVSVESEEEVGRHPGLELFTTGQRARISGASSPWFVAGKGCSGGTVYVAQGRDNPALYSSSAVAADFHWVGGAPPAGVAEAGFRCKFKARYLQKPGWCHLQALGEHQPDQLPPSRFCLGGSGVSGPGNTVADGDAFAVRFDLPARALTPHQALVLYDGDVCLGAGLLLHHGATLFELGESRVPPAALETPSGRY